MKHLIQKLAASKSKIIAHVKVGSDVFNLITREQRILGSYNGCDILKCDDTKEGSEKVARVVQDLIELCLKTKKNASVSVYKSSEGCSLDPFFDQMKSLPGVKKVVVKVLPDDRTEFGKSLQPDFDVNSVSPDNLCRCLGDFVSTIRNMSTLLKVCRDDALTITQGKLVNTMWGAKDMQDILKGLHVDVATNDKWDRVEFFSGIILKSIERLMSKLATDLGKVCAEEKRIVYAILVPNVLDNYETFKKVAISALLSLSSLIYIDAAFKRVTSYPAAWFLSGGMLDDLKQDYQRLLDLMLSMPRLERQVIYPLDVLRMLYLSSIPTQH